MFKVFIYHNEQKRKNKLKKAIQLYYEKLGRFPSIESCSNREEAIIWLRKYGNGVDILFLDCSDLNVALTMAQILRDDNLRASWVYVDGDLSGLDDCLLWRPSAKIDDSNDVKQIICTIKNLDSYHRTLQKKYDFVFKYEGEYIHIPFRNITYFESNAKKVTLYLRDKSKNYSFASKLEDIHKMLPGYFLRCHQSYLVNLDEVSRLDLKDHIFILNNNDDVPISRRLFTVVKEQYEHFLESR